jgi:hypothetical protein
MTATDNQKTLAPGLAAQDEDEALTFSGLTIGCQTEGRKNWLARGFTNVEDLRAHIADIGLTVEQFKTTSAYKQNIGTLDWLKEL